MVLEGKIAEQKKELEKYIAMPAADRDAKLAELKKRREAASKKLVDGDSKIAYVRSIATASTCHKSFESQLLLSFVISLP